MRLNELAPGVGAKRTKRRVGRGPGSGWGKTAARGQKGQKSRTGGGVRPGFEGGQMTLQMRLPKFGFRSRVGLTTGEVRLDELGKVMGDEVTLDGLIKANVLNRKILRAKVILSGKVDRALTVKGLKCTKGARAAIEAAGGKVED
ncbi:MAG: 50S ribosomal protein L15 [Pseudomonadales bacterium]